MGPARCLDQLARDAHPAPRPANAAFEDVPDAKLASHLLNVDGLPLIGEAGVASDHEQRFESRQSCDDIFDDAIGEVFLLWVSRHVLEGQHCDGWLVGKSERRRGRLRLRTGEREYVYGPRQVLERDLAPVLESDVDL